MSRYYILDELIKRTNAFRLATRNQCIFCPNKIALYSLPHLHNNYGGDVHLCGSCLRKYDRGQIKI